MAITQAVANVFKQELLKGNHNFISAAQGGGTAAYYLALYTSSATLGATTTAYATTNEITNTAGTAYSAGGKVAANPSVTGGASTATAFVDFDNVQWASASFTANGGLIYRQDAGKPTNNAVVILAFGGDFTATNGTFTVQFPTAGGGAEIIRLG
tara:strand:- start:216 stop:680 length:465 start_codon:yes stop_codon:yes gene_type:complete